MKPLSSQTDLELVKSTLGLSIAETADLFGVSKQVIYSWLGGNPIESERVAEISNEIRKHPIITEGIRIGHRAVEGSKTVIQLLKIEPAESVIGKIAEILKKEEYQRRWMKLRLVGKRPRNAEYFDF
jgi:hypothetical protein